MLKKLIMGLMAAALTISPAYAQTPNRLEVVRAGVTLCEAASDPYTGTVDTKRLRALISELNQDAQLEVTSICYAYSEGVLSGVVHARNALRE